MTQMKWQPIETAPQSNGWGARIVAYKGFDKDFSCRGYQYEVGKTYIHDGPAIRCSQSGYHSCEMPMDTWTYYGPATSRYGVVTASGQIDSIEGGSSKIASTILVVNQEIELPDLIEAAARWIVDRASGNIVTSRRGHAATTDFRGHAVATGCNGGAVARGKRSRAAATGDGGHAVATGGYGRAVAMGCSGHAAARGDDGHAVAVGHGGHAAVAGNFGRAAAMGCGGHAAATGDCGHAATMGNYAHAVATGDYGRAVATGYGGHAAATGDCGHAATMGDYGHAAVKGKNAIAAALGLGGTAEAGPDGWIVLSRWSDKGDLLEVRAAKVGTEGIEPGKRYRLTAAGFVVAADHDADEMATDRALITRTI